MTLKTDTATFFYRIAEHNLRLTFAKSDTNSMELLPSMKPFRIEKEDGVGDDLFIDMLVDDTIRPVDKTRRERIRVFDTGNGDTIVDKIDDGGYQFIIKNIDGYSCCLLITNSTFDKCRCALNGNNSMRQFGLNNALMLAYAFAGSFKDTALIHASLVRQNGKGYAFTAKSGTGKSTHVGLWLKHLPGCDLMNDDNPIIRIIDGKPYIYGGPWSGKTPCYRDVKADLGAIVHINRALENSVEKNSPIEAFGNVLPACSTMKWDSTIFNNLCNIVTKIVETTGIYTLHCLPNKEAAIICNKAISK